MQVNIKSGFCPKQNIFSFEKYAEMHMQMNGMMNEELGCYTMIYAVGTRNVKLTTYLCQKQFP
jgi:hypothetical protein